MKWSNVSDYMHPGGYNQGENYWRVFYVKGEGAYNWRRAYKRGGYFRNFTV